MSAMADLLPRVPGPKLGPFTPTGEAEIKFISYLGSPYSEHAYVWKVKINGKRYALKMVSGSVQFAQCDSRQQQQHKSN